MHLLLETHLRVPCQRTRPSSFPSGPGSEEPPCSWNTGNLWVFSEAIGVCRNKDEGGFLQVHKCLLLVCPVLKGVWVGSSAEVFTWKAGAQPRTMWNEREDPGSSSLMVMAHHWISADPLWKLSRRVPR
ncbi:hypothetical protein Nmel_010327, partial [Mimus melanotis]